MFNNILMPTDGSEHSERAIERGIALAKLCGAKVTGVHVLSDYRTAMAFADYSYPDRFLQEKIEDDRHIQAAKFLEFVRKSAMTAGVPCETVVATNDHPYDEIINTANEHQCDLIVMTSRYRRGLVSLVMGSETERVLHRTSIPVLMFRALMSADHPDKRAPGLQDVSHHSATEDAEGYGGLHRDPRAGSGRGKGGYY
jgi:nucleotide-binding universal stress UspA family protein